ncbi:hypothetical protein TSH100_18240 [Azospirillum sp. TSH100]|uniref:DUF3306 domain-containing protein n=1 Tax=Azospirillum sp. TSH100 TaxID=652764 RepID=UPI000D61C1F7|nr:DUF3306 domain-containing protein [Azospirillum sp. TSH100]PWC84486.1 hypothetical protein TSH100_18240 [Azospirillum sp. TSH100]QCG87602.1 DUF3306 domain-containing protein [Azospirillum sp. TSH100]
MSGEAFLSRWSRLKRTAVKPEPVPADLPPAGEEAAELPVPVAEDSPADAIPPEAEDPLKDLPPVEELTGESDFTPFLRAEVPEDLHRQALRKLWTSDPIYANDDGLKDYADDYASLFTGGVPVKTLYRVGKGFLDTLDEVAEGGLEAPPTADAEVSEVSDTPSPQPPIPSPPG